MLNIDLNRFNKQLYSFFCELNTLYPNDNELCNLKKKIYYGKIANSEKLYKEFINNVYPHKDEIIKRNEEYLMSIDNIFINKFKKYYHDETINNKKAIMDYLVVLVILSDKLK